METTEHNEQVNMFNTKKPPWVCEIRLKASVLWNDVMYVTIGIPKKGMYRVHHYD